MERWQRHLVLSLAVLVGMVGVFSAGFALGRDEGSRTIRTLGRGDIDGSQLIQQAYDEIMSASVDPPDSQQLARAAIKAMVKALREGEDPYALYYSPKGYRSFQEFTTGEFSGIGVWLKDKEGKLEIVSVLPSTPAKRSGLEAGDLILEVEGEEIDPERVDEAAEMIKGPAGTEVNLLVDRSGEKLTFEITRAAIELPNLQAKMTEDDVGHIRLLSFGRRAGEQVKREVRRLVRDGAKGIVLDLRDNGGGLFSEAIEVASAFIEDGEIVIYRDGKDDDITYEAEGEAFEDLPVVVLVNEGTASSSEIVAGAMQDRDRAVIIGTETYGKGSVQEVVPLADASAVKVTTAAYLTPSGKSLDGRGIVPDVEIDADPKEQLRRAIEVLNGLILSTSGEHG